MIWNGAGPGRPGPSPAERAARGSGSSVGNRVRVGRHTLQSPLDLLDGLRPIPHHEGRQGGEGPGGEARPEGQVRAGITVPFRFQGQLFIGFAKGHLCLAPVLQCLKMVQSREGQRTDKRGPQGGLSHLLSATWVATPKGRGKPGENLATPSVGTWIPGGTPGPEVNPGGPPRWPQRRSSSSASSPRTRAWRQPGRDRCTPWSGRSE